MPFNPNPTTGGTVYTPGQFFSGKVLTSDWMTDNAAWGKVGSTTAASNEGATLRTLPDLDIAVGKYERLIARYQIFYTGTANSDFKQLHLELLHQHYYVLLTAILLQTIPQK
jgi:hypothetical protein